MAEFSISWGGSGLDRLLERVEGTPRRLVGARDRALDRIDGALKDAANLGSGGIRHIRSGRLNDSLNGIGAEAVERRTDDSVSRGTAVRYAAFQIRRFGPLFPLDRTEPTRIVAEEMHRALADEE